MFISVDHVTKIYGKRASAFTALDDVSLSIQQGQSLAIVGKSGSGKSTLMHLLAALDRPTSGSITLNDQSLSNLSQRKLDTTRNETYGFIFQQFFLDARATCIENVALPLKIRGVGKTERYKRALEALKQVDMVEKAKNWAGDLSGGQKQRICIARALVSEPKVIFADEPTGNLDSVNGRQVEDLLFSLNKAGTTLIIVTHDEDLAAKCSQRVYMKDGKLSEKAPL